LLKQKVAQKVAIILGYFILSKNHNKPPKVAQLVKKLPNVITLLACFISLALIDNIQNVGGGDSGKVTSLPH
jgi:hypothetical protein